jgi:hypothetical protein
MAPREGGGFDVLVDGQPVREVGDVSVRFPADGLATVELSMFSGQDVQLDLPDAHVRFNVTVLPEYELEVERDGERARYRSRARPMKPTLAMEVYSVLRDAVRPHADDCPHAGTGSACTCGARRWNDLLQQLIYKLGRGEA